MTEQKFTTMIGAPEHDGANLARHDRTGSAFEPQLQGFEIGAVISEDPDRPYAFTADTVGRIRFPPNNPQRTAPLGVLESEIRAEEIAVEDAKLRDHYAGLALTSVITIPLEAVEAVEDASDAPRVAAEFAFDLADAMMAERARRSAR
jgi:hypothetical protein